MFASIFKSGSSSEELLISILFCTKMILLEKLKRGMNDGSCVFDCDVLSGGGVLLYAFIVSRAGFDAIPRKYAVDPKNR